MPPGRKSDLNPRLVCIFLVHATHGTLQGSAGQRWQTGGVPRVKGLISKPTLMLRTVRQLGRGSFDGAAATRSTRRLLPAATLKSRVGWLCVTAVVDPEREEPCARDACWLVLGLVQ